MTEDFWAGVKPGDPVEDGAGELVGKVLVVQARAVWVKDPREQRDLSFPRDALEPRPGGGLRVRRQAIRSAGEAPERSVLDADRELASTGTEPGQSITVEAEDPLHARPSDDEGQAIPAESDAGEAADNVPSELAHHTRRHAPEEDIRVGGEDRPSARKLTPELAQRKRVARIATSAAAPSAKAETARGETVKREAAMSEGGQSPAQSATRSDSASKSDSARKSGSKRANGKRDGGKGAK